MSEVDKLSIKHISLSADHSQLMINFAHLSESIVDKNILHLLQHPSFPKYKVCKQGITDAVKSFDNLFNNPDAELTHFSPIVIAEKRDAELEISISKDQLNAYAEIRCAYGGKHISLSEIKDRCDSLHISYGLMPTSILALINTCKKAQAGKFYRVTIASGIAPVNGTNASFKKRVKTDNHRKPTPQLLPNGNVDMHNLGDIITVKANTILMEKIPATPGKPGKTVTGKIINQIQGKDKEYILTDNVHLSENNPLQLVATIQGIPIDDGDFIRIDDVLLLPEVNVKTGNINYDGSVVITGDIQEGMKVDVSGDITVMGFIESAQVDCGGDLTVKNPIIGRVKNNSHDFCCEINCNGVLRGTIARYSRLNVKKEIQMSDQLMHCASKCSGSVFVHNDSWSKGAIIGGEIYAQGKILTTTIGTNAGSKTLIDLTGNYQVLAASKKKLIHHFQQIDGIIQKFQKAQNKADSILDPQKQKQTKKNLLQEKQIYRDESDKVQLKLAEIKLQLDAYHAESYVISAKKLHSGTTVKIAGKNLYIQQDHGPTNVAIVEDKINLSPYQKN